MSEKITRRSDGAYETPSGLFAVQMRVRSGERKDSGIAWFEFKAGILSPVQRVEWQAAAPFALLPQDTARSLVLLGYANGITDELMDKYNALVDAEGASAPVATVATGETITATNGLPGWVDTTPPATSPLAPAAPTPPADSASTTTQQPTPPATDPNAPPPAPDASTGQGDNDPVPPAPPAPDTSADKIAAAIAAAKASK